MYKPFLKTLCTLRHNCRFCCVPGSPPAHGLRASSGGQKYHASPHKAILNKRRCNEENKRLIQGENIKIKIKKTGRGKGFLVLAEAAIPSSGGQRQVKRSYRDKRETKPRVREVAEPPEMQKGNLRNEKAEV